MNKSNQKIKVNDLSLQVRIWRKFRKLKQRELEAMAYLGNNSISRIENGLVSPKLETIEKIAHALSLSVEELQFRVPPTVENGDTSDELNSFIERLKSVDEKKQSSLVQVFHHILDLLED